MVRKWSFGVLNDSDAEDVPGTVLLLPEYAVAPTTIALAQHLKDEGRRTIHGILLSPSPDISLNDPLNWPLRRRNAALLALAIYCMLGGGMPPLLAAGFEEVAHTFHISAPKATITTGLFELGLGIGGILVMPTALLFGKRPLYIITAAVFFLASIWCAVSPNFTHLCIARIVQGMAVSPVEIFPSATITEIFFLHERAFRLGVYTLLLLSGKNLIPLASAIVVEDLGWRSVFWMLTVAVGCSMFLLYFCLLESYWDRTPWPVFHGIVLEELPVNMHRNLPGASVTVKSVASDCEGSVTPPYTMPRNGPFNPAVTQWPASSKSGGTPYAEGKVIFERHHNEPFDSGFPEKNDSSFLEYKTSYDSATSTPPNERKRTTNIPIKQSYTDHWRSAPKRSYQEQLALFPGRLTSMSWSKAAIRPFILFAYPSILWSALVYSLSVGWLVVLSESVNDIYRNIHTYNFTPIQVGLVYISAFLGSLFGTAIAGKVSDLIVRYMAMRNGGVYEPEFRLLMAFPVAICSVAGLMGFGWSVEEHDNWIVPTVFFGIISFGCSLGSTTAITFCVDSYKEYAGEALVTLNFSKNIFHGLLFSMFFPEWLEAEGSKKVFVAVGIIQLACLMLTIPMFIYGKRARMWTARKNMMRKF
ncbi:MFS general substrate transporter [Tothia fuscella]|uniref:MFS general substrate transporter n=1 Tax=Tothia fuscella TaxID=1048955 RepID=A0A9P4TU22_9PEZI|nr:MFS general substrate transporter [Tothia fuscella]